MGALLKVPAERAVGRAVVFHREPLNTPEARARFVERARAAYAAGNLSADGAWRVFSLIAQHTRAALAAANVRTLQLYRGINPDTYGIPQADRREGRVVEIAAGPLESWSERKNIALGFAEKQAEKTGTGLVLEVDFTPEEAYRHHQYDQPLADKKEYEVMIMATKGVIKARVARVVRETGTTKKAAEVPAQLSDLDAALAREVARFENETDAMIEAAKAEPPAEYWDDPAWNPPITQEELARIYREHPEFDEEYRENVRRGRAIGCPEIGLVA